MNRFVAATALAAVGLFTAVVLTGSASTPSEVALLERSYASFKVSVLYAKYARQNPVESAAIDAYWANGGDPPVTRTPFGQALVLEGQVRWSEEGGQGTTEPEPTNTPTATPVPPTNTPTPTPPPSTPTATPVPPTSTPTPVPTPPPSSGALSWAPPGYDGSGSVRDCANYPGYTVWNLTDATRDVNSGSVTSTRSVCIVQTGPLKAVRIIGWVNVVWIGGELNQTNTNDNGLNLTAISGVAHLEGLWIHGIGLRDGVGIMVGKAPPVHGGTVRFQNCRIEAHTFGDFHGDDIQIWGNPGVGSGWVGGMGQFQVDRFTGVTDLQAIFLGNHDGALEGADIRNANVIGLGPAGGGQLLYKHARNDLAVGWPSVMTLTNFWMEQRPDPGTVVWAAPTFWVVPNANGTDWGNTPDPTRAAKLGSDSQGQYVFWVDTADVKGIARVGSPPGGDFVPEGVAGRNYVSPGYR